MKTLITMEQYVIDYKTTDDYTYRKAMLDYAKLLQSKPTLEHFIGDNAIFEGWSVKFSSDISMALVDDHFNIIEIKIWDNNHFMFNGISINTLSDLTKYNLKLK